jgi:hypothetical protein
MSARPMKGILCASLIVVWALLASGCAVGGGEYGYDSGGGVGVGFDYYDTYGGDYGGWGPGYRVGPHRDRGGDHGQRAPEPSRGRPSGSHSYHAPAAGRSVPSIPSGVRGGGIRH